MNWGGCGLFSVGDGWSDRQWGRLSFHMMLRGSNDMEGKGPWGVAGRVTGVGPSEKPHGAGDVCVTLVETRL